MTSQKILCLIFLFATLCGTQAAHAQFGSGIVYDPTQGAHAIQQIQQGENQLQKWAQELQYWQQHLQTEQQIYTTVVQTRSQIVTMYNLAYAPCRPDPARGKNIARNAHVSRCRQHSHRMQTCERPTIHHAKWHWLERWTRALLAQPLCSPRIGPDIHCCSY
jgi:hypothetical protein